MNSKTAKKIRKALKETGLDVKFALYDMNTIQAPTETEAGIYNLTLSDNSGRKLYKEAKRVYGA